MCVRAIIAKFFYARNLYAQREEGPGSALHQDPQGFSYFTVGPEDVEGPGVNEEK